MAGFRNIKRQARTALHEVMRVPALYLVETEVPDVYDQTPVNVRVHTQFKALGDLKGTNFQYAERQETVPQIVFQRSEITPSRGGIVSVEAGEAYRIDHVLPPDDEFVTAVVVVLSAAQAAGLPVPVA